MTMEEAMAAAGTRMAAETLAGLLARENTALEKMDFHAAGPLGPVKAAAVAGFIAAVSGGCRPEREQGVRLDTLAQANRVLLERAIAAQQVVVARSWRWHWQALALALYRQRAGFGPQAMAISACV